MARIGTDDMHKILVDSALERKLYGRYDFAALNVVGSGAYGVVFEEPFTVDNHPIIRKVDCIIATPKKSSDTFKPLDEVVYQLEKVGNENKYIVSCDRDLSILNIDQTLRLQKCVTQYEALRDLKGQKYFQQITAHPEIGTDREFFLLDGRLYVQIWMTKLPGDTLESLMRQKKKDQTEVLTPYDFATIIEQATDALMIMEDYDIEHGDIKPANIVIDKEGQDQFQTGIIDFGSGNLQKSTTRNRLRGIDTQELLATSFDNYLVGTPEYMAPEKVCGKSGKKSDAWSLGITLYQIITGKLPFNTWTESMHMIMEDETRIYLDLVRDSEYSTDLLSSISNLMTINPEKRNLIQLRDMARDMRKRGRLVRSRRSYPVYTPDYFNQDSSQGTQGIIEEDSFGKTREIPVAFPSSIDLSLSERSREAPMVPQLKSTVVMPKPNQPMS
ncbi:hypothetical protein COV12_01545 [Candidatus Woesearchaeota archaeon CG10_big_fil_rev_8_21_14_0_10_32_24]|nr:MAG: hypothetical protein COV12_01545 [Candidatus Woesearchaeota archaeon CG10_big_fil_rev_8_21_14_0_10_32_24]